jgi:hypothetical protein
MATYGGAPYGGAAYAGAFSSVTGTLGLLYNTILDPAQLPIIGVKITATLKPTAGFRLTSPLSEVARSVNTISSATGYWELPLESYLNITPANTYYEIREEILPADGGIRVWTCRVTANQTISVSAARITP